MGISIPISVDARQVNTARKAIEDLGSRIHQLGQEDDISLGGKALAADAEILRRAALDITRLGNISRIGEAKGGILNLQQWKDAATLSKRVGDNLGEWIIQSQKLRSELNQLNADMKGLQQATLDPGLSSKHRQMMLDEIEQLKARREEVAGELKGRMKGDSRAEHLRGLAEEYGGNVRGYGYRNENIDRLQSGFLRRLERVMVGTLAVAGGIGIGSLIARSLDNYRVREQGGSDFGALGIDRVGHASDYLYGERTGAQLDLARRTGFRNGGLTIAAAQLARGRFLGLDQVTGFMGSAYQATGMNEQGVKGLTAGTMAVVRNTARTADVMEGVERLIQTQQNQQGGAVSRDQASFLAAMFAGGFDKNVTLQKTSAYEKLNGWMASGGKNPGEQLLLWKMAGGDNFGGTMEGYEQVMANMSEGLTNPLVRKNFGGYLRGLPSDAFRRMALRSMAGLAPGQGREADLMLKHVFNSGLDLDRDQASIIGNMESAGASAETIRKIYGDYTPSSTRGIALKSEANLTRAGEKLGPKVQQLEEGLLNIGSKFLDGISKIHGVGDAFREGGKLIKDSVKELWNSGPLGQMVTILGGIYLGIKAIAGTAKIAGAVGSLLEVGGAAGAGGVAARAGMLARFAAGGPIAAGVAAGAYTMYGDLANVDESAMVKTSGKRVDAPSDNERATQHDLTNLLLQDISQALRSGALRVMNNASPSPTMGTSN